MTLFTRGFYAYHYKNTALCGGWMYNNKTHCCKQSSGKTNTLQQYRCCTTATFIYKRELNQIQVHAAEG